ncbi:hypothetical protein [Geothrix alkalitolerans]|uniref:hypothetical protein n=1 Tax=Geothrix alkalitolerans TaxID=2922724 RepID=UPI001FAFEF90|nr:hypothetical protein [Geothrix alkalitolerans]
MADPTPFPSDLAQVPEGERIPEAFGWAPAAWALACATFAQLTAFQPAKLDGGGALALGGAILGAVLLGAYEVRRRGHPKAMVRRGSALALYAKGRLDRQVEAGACQLYLRHPTRTWGPILMTGMGTLAAGSFLLPGGAALAPADRVTAGLAALTFAALFATIIRTRLFCEEVLLPYASGRGYQHVLIHKREVPRIFRPAA